MGLFQFGKKAKEEAERLQKEEEERRRKEAEEEAERLRKEAEEERERREAEEAERKHKEEEERKRKAAMEAERKRRAEEEAERLRKEQEEHKRREAEEAERKRKEEEKKRMAVYDNFASRTSVDCKVFAEAGYECAFDTMEYTAEITPAEQYLDSSYKDITGRYHCENGKKTVDRHATTISFDLKMLYNGTACVLYPRLNMQCWFGTSHGKTIGKVYVRIGGNRYVANPGNVTIYTERSEYGSYETDFSALPLGLKDLAVIGEIAEGKYPVSIRLGNGEGRMDLTPADIAGVKGFLDVCKRAGVMKQVELEAESNKFSVITKFNP